MSTEGINPTTATTENPIVTNGTSAFDDSLSTYTYVSEGTEYGPPAYDGYAWVRYGSFGNGTTPVDERNRVWIAINGKWGRKDLANGHEWVLVQIRHNADAWFSILTEHMLSDNWPTSGWRQFDVTSIVGENPLSEYEIRVGFYKGSDDWPEPEVSEPYTPNTPDG